MAQEKASKWIIFAISVAAFLFGAGGAVLGTWGTIQYKEGAREQRILTLESQVKELREQSITRREMAVFMESITEGIKGIRQDIRELRKQ